MKSFLLSVLLSIMVSVIGCASVNPVAVAVSAEQKADAMYDTFLVYKGQAVSLAQKPGTPQSVINKLASADRVVTPIMDSLQDAVIEVGKVRADLLAGESTEERLSIATDRLESWIAEAEPALQRLYEAISSAGDRAALDKGQFSEAAIVMRAV